MTTPSPASVIERLRNNFSSKYVRENLPVTAEVMFQAADLLEQAVKVLEFIEKRDTFYTCAPRETLDPSIILEAEPGKNIRVLGNMGVMARDLLALIQGTRP